MEKYIGSIRSGAMTVNEFIAFLKQFDGADPVNIGLALGCQLDVYELTDGIVFK